jgi:hypothetical protein
MPQLEVWLLIFTAIGLALGTLGIWWARVSRVQRLAFWGRGLFTGTLLFLGGSSLLAAFHEADGLVPLGLSAGLLVTGMLWEAPGSSS